MSSLDTVLPHLERLFSSQRIVLWNDPAAEYATVIGSVNLPGVTTLVVDNNEFGLKHQVLRQGGDGKFLLYRTTIPATPSDNWLLDLELAFGVFAADRASLQRQALGLHGHGIDDVVRHHERFFQDDRLVEKLRSLVDATDDPDRLRAIMCAVLLGQRDHSLLEITRTLVIANADGDGSKFDALCRFGLEEFHWQGVAKIYHYTANNPSVDDFILWTFRQAVNGFAADVPGHLRNIQLDFDSLRYSPVSAGAMDTLAHRAAADLDYASSIKGASLADLSGNLLFEDVERRVVALLARAIEDRTIAHRSVSETIRQRQPSRWVAAYRELHVALEAASEFLSLLEPIDLSMESFDEGLQRYRDEWFRVDQLYRRFHWALRATPYDGLLESLRKMIDRHYINHFLYRLGAAWQRQVDQVGTWESEIMPSQARFHSRHVDPVAGNGKRKLVVVVSDALRYEIADELRSRIRQEDRFDAELEAMLGMVPSYTQLGMAALLPHRKLAYSADGDPVLVDGQRSDGTLNRNKVLAAVHGRALQAEEVFGMTPGELRKIHSSHQVLYVYHDRIDATGDKARTERQVFESAEAAITDLIRLVKKLANANANRIVITADHGFLYQDVPLNDTNYLSTKPQGDELVVTNRRYVLGRGLKEDRAFRKFTASQLGLVSDLEVLIPKSVLRLRMPGAGSQFVHGGASLQEIVVPVLTVSKKRQSDIRLVNVEILPETSSITTGQLVVKLYQSEPVDDKVQPRRLRAGIFVGEVLVSNQPEFVFDQTSTESRDRYVEAHLLLSPEANAFNNQPAEFRLQEPIARTNEWRTYQRAVYQLKRSFTTDFDF